MPKPKIILFDLETAPIKTAVFSLWPNSIHHSNILEDWYIITICWKELGSSRIHSISNIDDPKRFSKNPADDYYVVNEFRKVLEKADAVSGHNVTKFDMKKFNTRLIYHKLPPLPRVHELDTLKLWKKITASTSNRLDYLSKFLGGTGKMQTSEGLWIRALNGEKKAIKEMVEYCKKDVQELEDFYLRIRPYVVNHPHLGAMNGYSKEESCPNCGSTDLAIHKYRYTASGMKRLQKQCKECHAYSTHITK